MGKLDGKVAVITGGSSGIGLATAKRFVEEGAHVVITGRREKELKEAAAFIKTNVTTVVGDVSRLEDLDRLYAVVKEKYGHIDILFANAGAGSSPARTLWRLLYRASTTLHRQASPLQKRRMRIGSFSNWRPSARRSIWSALIGVAC